MEQLMAAWRDTLRTTREVDEGTIDELESHLRETIDRLIRSGMTDQEAFGRAVSELGCPQTLATEFQKLDQPAWLPVKVATGVGLALLVADVTIVATQWGNGRMGLLLASHVFTVTLGYLTSFLIGAVGICFVLQRCLTDFSAPRQQSLRRSSFAFTSVAAVLIGTGVVLGMVWAKAEWGRAWTWDAKEIGGLCVILWLLFSLAAHRLRRLTTRGVILLSIVGNAVVSVAWFGPSCLELGLHDYGAPNSLMILATVVAANIGFFGLGLTPAGSFRLRRHDLKSD